jgi:hypothetical protein
MGTASFPGGKAAGSWHSPPPPPSAQIKERVELYLYSHSGPSWPVLERTLTFLPLPLLIDMAKPDESSVKTKVTENLASTKTRRSSQQDVKSEDKNCASYNWSIWDN